MRLAWLAFLKFDTNLTKYAQFFFLIYRGRTYAKKLRFFSNFTQKKSRLRKSENAVRLLYAKKQWPHPSKCV